MASNSDTSFAHAASAFAELLGIMRRLRSDDGCPWDRAQDHRSLRPYLLEETHEVLEAIDREDWEGLKEELGDLLLHVVFQSALGSEQGTFSIDDVIAGINEKMVRRHPHVFGNAEDGNAHSDPLPWEERKLSEGDGSGLEGVPETLPGLQRALRLQEKAAEVGFDWQDTADVWSKVREEMQELSQAATGGDGEATEKEFGDLLFALVNLARFLGVSPEDGLRRAIRKFVQRFSAIERAAAARNRSLRGMTLEEMDALWEREKTRESK